MPRPVEPPSLRRTRLWLVATAAGPCVILTPAAAFIAGGSVGWMALGAGAAFLILPALVVVDAVVRLVPGVVGDDASVAADSFADGLLDYPHYTRPAEFRGMKVPDVLLSGHHAEIARWRQAQQLQRTEERRPDLLRRQALNKESTS